MRHLLNVLLILTAFAAKITASIPGCHYFDTVDLSSIGPLENGSYLYNNIVIPPEKVGYFSYRKTYEDPHKETAPYPRGCICQERLCLHLCCSTHEFSEADALNVTLRDGTAVAVNVLKEFIVVPAFNQSCDLGEEDSTAQWTLFENGLLHHIDINQNFHKSEYCLHPIKLDDEHSILIPRSLDSNGEVVPVTLSTALRVISVFCLIVTILTYLYVPKLHVKTYDMCCIFYFICLTTSFSLLFIEELNRKRMGELKKIYCQLMGYTGFYAVMATFLWLIAINIIFWKTFRQLGVTPKFNFKKFNFFVWSIAAGLLLIVVLADEFIQDEKWKPGVAFNTCWIRVDTWSAMIYLYGPIAVALVINIVLLTITASSIYKNNRDNQRAWNNPESRKNVTNLSNFSTFFRMFVVAGVVWLLEIIAYMSDIRSSELAGYFDIITTSQGVVLFFVTILKVEVLKALYERILLGKEKSRENNAMGKSPAHAALTGNK